MSQSERVSHDERARKLLAQMTVAEKVAQLHAVWLQIEGDGTWSFRKAKSSFIKPSVDEPMQIMADGVGQITRPLGTRPTDAKECVRGLNAVQEFLVKRTRLGIPALAHEECLPGLMARGATQMPAAINYGASWDPELMERVAAAIGDEMVAVGSRQALSPVLDVARDARWGRTEETFGEDPYLSGCMAIGYIRGLQGDGRAIGTLKHYVGHSFSEGGRNHAPVRIGMRELNDVFLLPFEMAVKLANAGSVMPAYHDIDGEPSSSSPYYLTKVLREQWGFDGIIVSDYDAIRFLKDHHAVASDYTEASALALKAGMDQELPSYTCYRDGLVEALKRGLVEMAEIDAAVLRVLVTKLRLGLFENPYTDEGAVVLNTEKSKAVAREMAEKSIVLIKNDGMLPMCDEGTTGLIGPLADDELAVFCGYSFPVHLIAALRTIDQSTKYARTLRESMTDHASAAGRSEVVYARGCDILIKRPEEQAVFPGDAEGRTAQTESMVSFDESRIADAVEAASKADRIVVALGDLAGLFLTGTVGEGSDASSLELPGVQQKLLDALLDLGKPTVVVLLSGRPYNIGSAFDRANAVIQAWLPGQEGMDAITAILYGDASPGGRLPVSVPKHAGAMPYFYNHKVKSPGAPIQPEFGALYPFGFGLSYTEFTYEQFSVAESSVPVDGSIELSFTLANVGEQDGDEVVQLYVRDKIASLVRPIKELKGFRRISLKSKEAVRVDVRLSADMLAFTKSGLDRVVEPGEFDVMIGSSSEDIHFHETITVTGQERTLPEQWRMLCDIEVRPAG